MNKKVKILALTLMLLLNCANASLFWNIQAGIDYFRSKKYNEALEYFNNYIDNNPNDKDGYFWLAKTFSALKDDKNALEYYKKAYELTSKEKNIDKVAFSLNDTYDIEDYFDMAAAYFETGDIKQAEFYADMMLKINPKSSSGYFIKAKIAKLKNDTKSALEYFNKALMYNSELLNTNLAKSLNITKLPDLTKENCNLLALNAYFSGDIDLAIYYYKKYLELDSTNVDILNILSELYIKNNNFNAASETISKVLNLNPNNARAYLNQALIDGKIETLLKAYKINPNNSETLLKLGNYYLEKNDYINAKKYFEILTNVDSSLYEGYFGYIYCLIQTGEIENAMNLIRKISSLNPNSCGVLYLLSQICTYSAEYKEALDYLKQIEKREKNPNYYSALALVNHTLSNYEASLDYLNKAVSMPYSANDEDIIDEYFIRNYLALNNYDAAYEYMNNKNLLDKNRLLYKYYLYVIYKSQGNDKEAQIRLKQVKNFKPVTLDDYIDLSEINFYENKKDASFKVLESAIKKFPNSSKPYLWKARLNFKLANNLD